MTLYALMSSDDASPAEPTSVDQSEVFVVEAENGYKAFEAYAEVVGMSSASIADDVVVVNMERIFTALRKAGYAILWVRPDEGKEPAKGAEGV